MLLGVTARTQLTHLAVSVPDHGLNDVSRRSIAEFYLAVFGWPEIDFLAKPDRLTLLVDREARQYLNVRARSEAMVTSDYEHLGVAFDDEAEFLRGHAAASSHISDSASGWVSEPKTGSGGEQYWRVRYLLPITIEAQLFPAR